MCARYYRIGVINRRTVHDLVDTARARYTRIDPVAAYHAMAEGAVLIDTRDGDQRRRDGLIPGALIIDRTVLEWRVDPSSGATHPEIPSLDTRMILLCDQGYSSSLAVASLLDLGATDVTDVIGGFQAWCAAGLPVERRVGPDDDQLCAVCGTPVTEVTSAPAQPNMDDTGPRNAVAWVRLEPCGHTFMIESGGLIH
jgi:rhodanese-related sulfurtransferase